MDLKELYISFQVASANACLVAQLCPTLWDLMDCSPPGSSVHGILQASTGMGCHVLLQGILSTQGSNPHLFCLLNWQMSSLPLMPPGKPMPSWGQDIHTWLWAVEHTSFWFLSAPATLCILPLWSLWLSLYLHQDFCFFCRDSTAFSNCFWSVSPDRLVCIFSNLCLIFNSSSQLRWVPCLIYSQVFYGFCHKWFYFKFHFLLVLQVPRS